MVIELRRDVGRFIGNVRLGISSIVILVYTAVYTHFVYFLDWLLDSALSDGRLGIG